MLSGVLRVDSSSAAWLSGLLLSTLSCDGSLRLVVVDQSGSNGLPNASTETGGALSATQAGGTSAEGGSLELAAGGTPAAPPETPDGAAGAPPEVAIWDQPARYLASFTSFTYPTEYVRYLDGFGIIANIGLSSAVDKEQASFEITPGLYDKRCSAFRALNKPASFFRHSGSRIYLNPASSEPLFLADATFCEEPGLADPAGVTFRSSNYPGRVIHLRNQHELWIDDVPNPILPDFASDATFYRHAPLIDEPSP